MRTVRARDTRGQAAALYAKALAAPDQETVAQAVERVGTHWKRAISRQMPRQCGRVLQAWHVRVDDVSTSTGLRGHPEPAAP